MIITDRIDACRDGRERSVPLSERRYVVVHRSGMGANAKTISEGFQAPGEAGDATGRQMPYHIVIGRYGSVEQALRLTDHAPHALSWSRPGIAVAVAGDPRVEPPTRLQYEALVEVCVVLSGWLGGAEVVRGHDELRDGSRDPARECPGRFLDMRKLRADVKEASRLSCENAGFYF